jgi:hypothetical protein
VTQRSRTCTESCTSAATDWARAGRARRERIKQKIEASKAGGEVDAVSERQRRNQVSQCLVPSLELVGTSAELRLSVCARRQRKQPD